MVLTTRISKLYRRGSNCDASAFSLSKAEIAPDGEYQTRIKRRLVSSPACYKASFKANIKSASDFCWPAFRGNKIRCSRCSCLAVVSGCLFANFWAP